MQKIILVFVMSFHNHAFSFTAIEITLSMMMRGCILFLFINMLLVVMLVAHSSPWSGTF
ncbi:MAG: hypothetical protein P4M14_04205 [Gammaproteobacteria bacterium]|nr:hypothetical protein [Gammaproteobacteria bacterium]